MREPGRLEFANACDMAPGIGSTWHLLGYVLLANGSAGLVERRRPRELGVDFPPAREPAELIHRPLHCDLWIGVVRQSDLADARFSGASGVVEHLAELGPGFDGDHGVAVTPRQTTTGRPRHRDADRRGCL